MTVFPNSSQTSTEVVGRESIPPRVESEPDDSEPASIKIGECRLSGWVDEMENTNLSSKPKASLPVWSEPIRPAFRSIKLKHKKGVSEDDRLQEVENVIKELEASLKET